MCFATPQGQLLGQGPRATCSVLAWYLLSLTAFERKTHCCVADVLLDRSALDRLAHQAVSEELADLLPNSSKPSGEYLYG